MGSCSGGSILQNQTASIYPGLLDVYQIDPVDAGHCLMAYGDPAAIPAVRESIESTEQEDWVVRSLEFCIAELEGKP